MALQRRRRQFRPFTLTGRDVVTYNGQPSSDTPKTPVSIAEHQITWSEGHPWPSGRGKQNVGGPFETIRTRYKVNYDVREVFSFGQPGAIQRKYTGNVLPVLLNNIPPALLANATDQQVLDAAPSLGDATLLAKGATAISNSAPTSPVVDGSVAIGELYREGLPNLIGHAFWKDKTRVAQAAGGEYLNLQFGWLPLVSDIKATAKAIVQTEAIVKQLLRDSGKNVRRHYSFPSTTTMTNTLLDQNARPWPVLTINHWTTSGATSVAQVKTEKSIWFDGCFTYYIDPDSLRGLEGAATQARLIYGMKLTPDVVWNLLGWSWLIDWVVNVGPVMKNIGLFANDGLTLRYGYTMEETIVTNTWSYPRLTTLMGTLPNAPKMDFQIHRKRRLEQSPFVLGLTGAQFTARRGAILTALGLTRLR